MEINIIGIGAVGSFIGTFLTRLGIPFKCYDFDNVEEKNLNNQAYQSSHINMLKVDAMERIVQQIDPNIVSMCEFNFIKVNKETAKDLTGIVFLCVDSIKERKGLTKGLVNAERIIDTRMGKESGRILMFNPKDIIESNKYKQTLFSPHRVLDEQSCGGEPDCGFTASLLASNALIMMKNIGTEKEINNLEYSIHWFEYITEKWKKEKI